MNKKHGLWLLVCLSLVLGGIFTGGCDNGEQKKAESVVQEETAGLIVAVGDSLTAGLGLDEAQAFPALLAERLKKDGRNYQVVNSGVSGETSSGTLSRIDWILTMKPDIVILETGANDGLRGQDVELLQKNLEKILRKLQQADVEVVLTGMLMVWNLGEDYTSAFNMVYPDVAEKFDYPFMEFFLQDVATVAELNLDDGLHPNHEGYKRIVENLYPHVIVAIDRLEKKRNSR
ncbi:arylesterase [Desulfopila sp. IMCC35008]|uniref:arylesterase n=1 Tax=Desulfopila sp. IMCC35008 TaxID=2653858 RepID=UPI001F100ACE|nr:arylesterase [Desulfopila sp. IMCC35008]